MNLSQFDVLIVGAGAAGLTAAIGLARTGFRVAVVEAAPYPGAENWSGCVYFVENLVDPDILGPDGVEALAWERRLVERGFFATDGHGIFGATYRDPEAFRHCYTVLRPIYDHHLGQVALGHGVALLNATTAESLIRDGTRVIGVATNRGPLYADLVFLAEGDAAHLVTREGYDRSSDPRDAPEFLQGIKQVIELPPGAIEERFGVGAADGVAYEMLVRNGTLNGRPLHLNMGGFVYTNRTSLSVGLVLPAANLARHFDGDPNLLLEWFEDLPALRPWLRDGRRTVFGAKLIRGGGAQDIPTLVDDGLAIGGAASAIGLDFPHPNYTGPATAMGLLIVRAAKAIRAAGGDYTRAALERHYLGPLRLTHYWKDLEFLRRWPEYIERTHVLFGRQLDLVLCSAYVWTRPRRWFLGKMRQWLRYLNDEMTPWRWAGLRADRRRLEQALRLREAVGRPAFWRMLLDGSLNALRDLVGRPRAGVPPAGELRWHFHADNGAWSGDHASAPEPPRCVERWSRRFHPVLAAAARAIYRNDTTPFAERLSAALDLLVRQINVIDVLAASGIALTAAVANFAAAGWRTLRRRLGSALGRVFPARRDRSVGNAVRGAPPSGPAQQYVEAALQARDLTPVAARAARSWDDRLARLAYQGGKRSHIRVLWPLSLVERNSVSAAGLWHVCPAHVFETQAGPQGQMQVVVNFDNCIKCETCWRTTDLVDWGRDGEQRFAYPVHSPVLSRVVDAADAAGLAQPVVPRRADPWAQFPAVTSVRPEAGRLIEVLEASLARFDAALAEEPRLVGRDRAEWLEALARHAQQVARRLGEVLGASGAARPEDGWALVRRLADGLAVKAEERSKHTWDRRFSWAAADGRQIRQHHLTGVRRLLGAVPAAADASWRWLAAESALDAAATDVNEWTSRLGQVFSPGTWRELENGQRLTPAQDRTLRELAASVPAFDDPGRAVLLAELARIDPALAYRVGCHVWARDLALAPVSGDAWAAFAILEAGEALFVPAVHAKILLLLDGDRLVTARSDELQIEPQGTLGLRGAGMARVRFLSSPPTATVIDRAAVLERWSSISSADLAAIALGMADVLCRRAIEHATTRVQFPGLLRDEEARDAIGKFGAVKRLVAAVAARRLLIETLTFAPRERQAGGCPALIKALIAECLSAAAYDAGQVFGGMGYSEEDVLAKLYRDAAVWRFLGRGNVETWQSHGRALLRDWRPDGAALTQPDDGGILRELQQRQALLAEYNEVQRLRARVVTLVEDWMGSGQANGLQVAEGLARLNARLHGAWSILLRTHARLEHGRDVETDVPLLRVWLEETAVALDEFADGVRATLEPEDRPGQRPLVDPCAAPPVTSYAEFLARRAPYDSGDFLCTPVVLDAPRAVPEMVQTDPALATANEHYRTLLHDYFDPPRDGLSYERRLERQHRPSAADLAYCCQQGLLRTLLPRDAGGDGKTKMDFYLLLLNLIRQADVGLALVLQVHSSVGINPILLARDKNLPAALQQPGAVAADELARRVEACNLALKWIASGQVAAFALTEPNAGSDTARIATRAVLRSVPLEREPDGVLRFVPFGGREARYLIDASRIDFSTGVPAYRWSDDHPPAPIQFGDYDYDTDDPNLRRYYDQGGRRVAFSDVAQVRQRDGALWYDYWEVEGAKMWITSGRIAGVFCLYARTAEGPTGFIVDRHAEGLVVGKDEEKLGQQGSPTNELSLMGVRVPRENVLGVEGRGQVNALEALNAGRAGMAMSALAQTRRVIEEARGWASRNGEQLGWRLRRMEEDEFLCAALAFDVVGRAEHPDTKSARLESAVAKMICTELVQQVVELAEEVHGLAGQTTAYLVEKRKRDARVLTIYEGTSEIQRFLVLRDLVDDVALRWGRSPPRPPQHLAPEALELEALKAMFRQRVDAALALFGEALWQNPNLQANVFALPEAAAWLKAADSVLGRMAWLCRHGGTDDEPAPRHPVGARALARAFAEVRDRLRRFDDDLTQLRRGQYAPHVRAAALLFDRLRYGERETRTPQPTSGQPVSSVLVVVEPFAADVPEPYVVNGRLLEAHWCLSSADRAALETALALRDSTPGHVTVEVAAVGPSRAGQVLREALHLGTSRATLIVSACDAMAPDAAAAALVHTLRSAAFDTIVWGDGGAHADGTVGMLVAEALAVPQRIPVAAGALSRRYTTTGYLTSLARRVESLAWPSAVRTRPLALVAGANTAAEVSEKTTTSLGPAEAAERLRGLLHLDEAADNGAPFAGPFADLVSPPSGCGRIIAVVAVAAHGRLSATAGAVVSAARWLAADRSQEVLVLLIASPEEAVQRAAVGRLLPWCGHGVVDIAIVVKMGLETVQPAALQTSLSGAAVVIGEPWTEGVFAALGQWHDGTDRVAVRVRRLSYDGHALVAETTRMGGKLAVRDVLAAPPGGTVWISFGPEAESVALPKQASQRVRVSRWSAGVLAPDMARVLAEARREAGVARLVDADVIVDVGFGVGGRDGYDAVIAPLEQALRDLGVRGLVVGGSRKVTEELRLLAPDRQIGQSGMAVNPQVLIAIGVSGAPQHLNYIGQRAVIVAFNRDPEAPLMTLNRRQPRPKVIPVIGDLFETVPALTATLRDGKE
jgi:alkylation response protein AidB-like acyl-CoA dehydrogenase/flavin-dependent dehydrogenase/electron transfer flavoprotein alpha subunit/ferredoxin-like protein FixX